MLVQEFKIVLLYWNDPKCVLPLGSYAGGRARRVSLASANGFESWNAFFSGRLPVIGIPVC